MNLACPECGTLYRLNPRRIPAEGVRTRCRECNAGLLVTPPSEPQAAGAILTAETIPTRPEAEATVPAATRAPAGTEPGKEQAPVAKPTPKAPAAPAKSGAPAAGGGTGGAPPVFGPQDPHTRAKRLARALVSDIVVYHPDRRRESLEAGTLRKDFRDEILKSWEEYVEQVGQEMAQSTPYFRDALNDILAEGKRMF